MRVAAVLLAALLVPLPLLARFPEPGKSAPVGFFFKQGG